MQRNLLETITREKFDRHVRHHQTESNQISTGKSLSEALIFASTNPQYDDRLLIELQVQ